jgi:hypothetical protein
MAESKLARLKRYARGDWTKRELETLVGLMIFDQVIDVATGGRLSGLKLKALKNVVIPAVSLGGRVAGQAALGTARVLGSSALGAVAPIVTNPYVAGTALGLGALQTEPGQQLLEMAEERGRMDRIRFEQALTDVTVKATKTKSKFNTAVSRGMKAVKNSTSYGKKGVISAPKKAFAAVVGVASKLSKAKKSGIKLPKPPKIGIRKNIYKSMLGLFK